MKLLSLTILLPGFTVLTACDDGTTSSGPVCGDGTCARDESPAGCPADCPAVCGDGLCTAPGETAESCAEDCVVGCALTADLSPDLATGALFYGYPALGRDAGAPSCGAFPGGREVYLSFTPDFTGELVVSTRHPSTDTATFLEVRQDTCDGSPLGCAAPEAGGTELTVTVQALSAYVVVVETAGAGDGVFALSLRRRGACDGVGTVTDVTGSLLGGDPIPVDTAGEGTLAGSCGGGSAPEARVTFLAPATGEWIATCAHPATGFDTLLHLREGAADGGSFCASPEAEIGCDDGDGPAAPAAWLRFEAVQGLWYDLFVDGAAEGAAGMAVLTLGLAADSPAAAALGGCSHTGYLDRFAFFATAGAEVTATADTANAQTAADLRLRVRDPDGVELHEADDDFACTYPPPQWSCPTHTFTASRAGLHVVEVYVGTSEACADRTRVDYTLAVTVGGAPAEMILFGDQ